MKTYTAYFETAQETKDYIYSLSGTEFKVRSYGYKDNKFYVIVEY